MFDDNYDRSAKGIPLVGYYREYKNVTSPMPCKCQVKMYNFGGLKCTISVGVIDVSLTA